VSIGNVNASIGSIDASRLVKYTVELSRITVTDCNPIKRAYFLKSFSIEKAIISISNRLPPIIVLVILLFTIPIIRIAVKTGTNTRMYNLRFNESWWFLSEYLL
jgi:hypothetical protein